MLCASLAAHMLDFGYFSFVLLKGRDETSQVETRRSEMKREKLKGTHCNLFFIKKPLTDSSFVFDTEKEILQKP